MYGAIYSTIQMMEEDMQKNFNLSETDIEVLRQIKQDIPEVNSEVDAVRFLIRRYGKDRKEEVKLNHILDEDSRIRKTHMMDEQNTEMVLDVLNTLLFREKVQEVVLKDEIENQVISKSRENIRNKIAHNKQKKDFRSNLAG